MQRDFKAISESGGRLGDATITIDDQPVAGRAYMCDIWQPTLKADKRSCVFAIAETFTPWQQS